MSTIIVKTDLFMRDMNGDRTTLQLYVPTLKRSPYARERAIVPFTQCIDYALRHPTENHTVVKRCLSQACIMASCFKKHWEFPELFLAINTMAGIINSPKSIH